CHFDGSLRVAPGRRSNQLVKFEIREDAHPSAPDCRSARECNYRNAHPEGVKCAGMAVVREWVEAQVEAMKATEVLGAHGPRQKLDAIAVDPALEEQLPYTVAVIARLRLKDKSRPGQLLEDTHPQMQGRRRHLEGGIQAAERHIAAGLRREWTDRGR